MLRLWKELSNLILTSVQSINEHSDELIVWAYITMWALMSHDKALQIEWQEVYAQTILQADQYKIEMR